MGLPLHKYPYFPGHVSCRLSESSCQLRNLHKIDSIVVVNGSAYLSLGLMDGTHTLRQIADSVALTVGMPNDVILEDSQGMLAQLLEKDLVVMSATPVPQSYFYHTVVSERTRSSLHFDITHKCNEDCIHCLVDKDNIAPSYKDVEKVIVQAARLGFTSMSLSGGEPLLHPKFWDILKAVRKWGFSFTLFTNGSLWNDDSISRLVKMHPEMVRVSLYSVEPSIHDAITCVPGSFQRTLNTIVNMRAQGLRMFVNCPVMNKNYDGFERVAHFCRDHGIQRNFDPVIQHARNGQDKHERLQLTYEQAKHVTGFQQDADTLVVNVRHGVPVCNVGEDPSIDAGLNLYPCPGVRFPLGNMRDASLKDLLEDNPVIETLAELCLDNLEQCQSCNVRSGCYRCHGHAYQETGEFHGCSTSDRRQASIRRQLMIERGTLKEPFMK